MIQNNSENLKQRILNALSEAKFKTITGADEEGNIQTNIVPLYNPSLVGENEYAQIRFDNPENPPFSDDYGNEIGSGMEKIVDAITREVLSYVVENAEVVIKERMNELENDFNALLQSFFSQAVSLLATQPPTTPVTSAQLGTILQTVVMSAGETVLGARTLKTEGLKAEENLRYNGSEDIG